MLGRGEGGCEAEGELLYLSIASYHWVFLLVLRWTLRDSEKLKNRVSINNQKFPLYLTEHR